MTQIDFDNESGKPCKCDNCDWTGKTDDLESISDAQERLTPGGTVPAGQCPNCGALAYLDIEIKLAETSVTIYRGVPVFCSGKNPTFRAHYGKQHFSGGSFKTLRDKLDAALEFKPFTCLQFNYRGNAGTVEVVSVIGIERDGDKLRYVTEAGRKLDAWTELYPDTPVMRERMETHLAEREEFARREADIKAGQQTERAAMEALRLPKLEN